MMSVEMQRVYDVAAEIDKDLKATDPRFRHSVYLIHEEGTTLFFENAFIVRYYDRLHRDWGDCSFQGEWAMVFTEHHGFHVYPLDDLVSWNQFKKVEIEEHPTYTQYQSKEKYYD